MTSKRYKSRKPHVQVRHLSPADLLSAIRTPRFRTRGCVAAFLERCQDEAVVDPREALPLLVEAPEYVERTRKTLASEYPALAVWSYGVVGSGLNMAGSRRMASRAFRLAREVRCNDMWELAALDSREAVYEAGRRNPDRARELADRAVDVFETDDPGCKRDDRSLAGVLMARGVVELRLHTDALGGDLKTAEDSFHRALTELQPFMRRTRQMVVVGIGTLTTALWFSGNETRTTSRELILSMRHLRKQLRRQKMPRRSLVDASARWLLALGAWRLEGGLTPDAEVKLRSAHTTFCDLGRLEQAAQLNLDWQWCLVNEGRWKDAIRRWNVVESLKEQLPEAWQQPIELWGSAIRARAVSSEIITTVYRSIRGLHGIQVPGTTSCVEIKRTQVGW